MALGGKKASYISLLITAFTLQCGLFPGTRTTLLLSPSLFFTTLLLIITALTRLVPQGARGACGYLQPAQTARTVRFCFKL